MRTARAPRARTTRWCRAPCSTACTHRREQGSSRYRVRRRPPALERPVERSCPTSVDMQDRAAVPLLIAAAPGICSTSGTSGASRADAPTGICSTSGTSGAARDDAPTGVLSTSCSTSGTSGAPRDDAFTPLGRDQPQPGTESKWAPPSVLAAQTSTSHPCVARSLGPRHTAGAGSLR
jgi:hypothetical protein